METQTAAQDEAAASHAHPAPRRWGWRAAAIACICLSLFGATEWAVSLMLRRSPWVVTVPVSILAMVGVAIALAAGGAAVRVVHHWLLPVTRAAELLEEIHAGRIAAEAWPAEAGGLTPLLPPVAALLKQIREQRAEIAQLEREMRQRVAQRTGALERMMGSLRAQAARDTLTGLFNRRMLDDCLAAVVQRSAADGAPLCVLMMDLDDFKLLNDTLGHAAGDGLLKGVGQLIRSSLREEDLAFRYGGDEFVVVLPGVGRADGEDLGRRLAELVDGLAKNFPLPRRPGLSVGACVLADAGRGAGPKELLEAADRRLYVTKARRKSGKGRAA